METRNRTNETATGLGPYKATRLWNDVIAAFRQGIPRGKHRRYMRTVEDCFVGSAAVDWLLEHLKKQKDFGSDVTRQQTTQLLHKLYKAGIFEELQVSRRSHKKNDFSDSSRLYRLLPASPGKSTRVPLATRSTNNVPSPPKKYVKNEKSDKQWKFRLNDGAHDENEKLKVEDNFDVDRLPQCRLIGRFLTGSEINDIWKTAVLSRLKKVLNLSSLEDILQDYTVNGGYVRHNCIFLNKSGIVTNIRSEDQLPHWVLSAMKCLARWPEKVEGDLPSYPGFENDVFGVVRDYFLGLQEPLISYELYDIFTGVFVQACNQLPRHSSPLSNAAVDQIYSGQNLWSDASVENVILNFAQKHCMDSKPDLSSIANSRPDLCCTTDGYSKFYSHSDLYSVSNSMKDLVNDQKGLAKSHHRLRSTRDLQSHGDLHCMMKHQTDIITPATHSYSHKDLCYQGQYGLKLAQRNSHTLGMSKSFNNLHGKHLVRNQHASASLQNLGISSFGNSKSASGRFAECSSFRESKLFSSNPDLQVTRYETAFGPENQTVTRVYYPDGVATDIHHSSEQSQNVLSSVETHFDMLSDTLHKSPQSAFQNGNRSSNIISISKHSKSATDLCKQQSCGVLDFASRTNAAETAWPEKHTELISEHPETLVWVKGQKACHRRRNRKERSKTFAGSQFTGLETERQGLEDWERQLSASTPYLPGLRLPAGHHHWSTAGSRSRQLDGRTSLAGGTTERHPLFFMNFLQSGLLEERAKKALQAVSLFLPPASRRKLHFLLKLMSKMVANPFLTFDPSQSTRSLVLGTFQHAILRSPEESDLDAVLEFQIVSFLVDNFMDILAVPTDMKEAVEDRLRSMEKPQIVYSPRDPNTVRFSLPVSMQQYEAMTVDHSHQALVDLLSNIVQDQNMADQEKQRRLRQFQKTYPHIYKRRFPDAKTDPLQGEMRPRSKLRMLPKPLQKLRGLRV